MDTEYKLPSEYPIPARKFKNIEFLRFLMAWAIVGFHLMHVKTFAPFGLSFVKNYTGQGEHAVWYFFLISFFFLILKTRSDCSAWHFVRNKWLRMAPPIIAVTLIGYILHLCGFWGWNTTVNIEASLLMHNLAAGNRWLFFFDDPAWFCTALFLVSVIYFSWVKSLPAKLMPLVLFTCSILSVGIWSVTTQFQKTIPWLIVLTNYGRAFTCLGLAYLLAHICVERVFPALQGGGKLPVCKRVAYSLLEGTLLTVLICSLYGAKWYRLSYLVSIISFAGLFLLFVRGGGIISRFLDRDWCVWLGRYAFGIFIVHKLVLRVAREVLPSIFPAYQVWVGAHPWVLLGGIAAATMLLAMLGYHFIEVPIARFIKSKS